MKIVVQRASSASVSVKGKIIGRIKKGYMVLFGVCDKDNTDSALKLAEKLYKLRVMSDENGKMNLNLKDAGGEVLVVSQFTLYADTTGGNRPSFIKAAEPKLAEKLYLAFIRKLRELGLVVASGKFGAYMKIQVDLDGPVTIIIEEL